MTKLLSIDTNAKTVKGQSRGYLTGILYLAPSDESKVINVCPHASAGCRAACLYTAGRGRFEKTKEARIRKTIWFKNDRVGFLKQLREDIGFLDRKATKKGLIPCVRLNGTSDLPWENFDILNEFKHIQFYDYTKHFGRMVRFVQGMYPSNYHLTFSRSETNNDECVAVANSGGNVAVVFSAKNYPSTYYSAPVVNGDESDLRFLDPKNVVVGLYAKGKAKKDESGFVVHI